MSDEKEKDTRKKQKKRLLLFTTIIVLSIVVLIVLLMETTGIGTGAPTDPSSTTSATTSTTTGDSGEGTGSLGDATSTSGLPEEDTRTFGSSNVKNGTLLLVDGKHPFRGTIDTEVYETDLYADKWRKDADGNVLYHVRGSARKKLDPRAAEAFVALITAYRTAVERPIALEVLRAFDDAATTSPYFTAFAIGVGVRDARAVSWGLADLQFAKQTEWLFANMHRFGFIYVAETQTSGYLRYVGIPHAAYMHDNESMLTTYEEESILAAYLKCLRSYTYTQPLSIQVDDRSYAVYYIPASESGDFSGTVPKQLPYSFSGDNIGGILVTYEQ